MRITRFIIAVLFLIFASSCMAKVADAGSIISWGNIVYDSNDFPLTDVVAITAGGWHSLALKSDGSMVGWGVNSSGQASPPSGNDFVAIAAGDTHNLALKPDGSIVGWGENYYGQAEPPSGDDFVAIAAGATHSLAIKKLPCPYVLVGDLNNDCRLDFLDFAMMAANWLIDCDLAPQNPACVPK